MLVLPNHLQIMISIAVLFLFTGCANLVLEGYYTWSSGILDSAVSIYKAPKCFGKTKKWNGPDAIYVLAHERGNLVLLEIDKNGKGVMIDNHWYGKKGHDNFLTYANGGSAWHYIISSDIKFELRMVFQNGFYTPVQKNGVTKVIGKPFVICRFIKIK